MELASRRAIMFVLATGVVAGLIFLEIYFCVHVGDIVREIMKSVTNPDFRYHHPLRLMALLAGLLLFIMALKFILYWIASRRLLPVDVWKTSGFMFLSLFLALVSLCTAYVSFVEAVGFNYDL